MIFVPIWVVVVSESDWTITIHDNDSIVKVFSSWSSIQVKRKSATRMNFSFIHIKIGLNRCLTMWPWLQSRLCNCLINKILTRYFRYLFSWCRESKCTGYLKVHMDIEPCSCIFVIDMRLWQNARKETEAVDRRGITAKWEKTFWKRTAKRRG